MSEPTSNPASMDDGPPEAERTVLGLIRALQSGELSVAAMSPQDRRRVVEHLWAEGYSTPETAEVLGVSERTIIRERKSIRQANAIKQSPELTAETVGALVRQADTVIGRLRRVGRERDTPPGAKIEAERACWEVMMELVKTLQGLGYLPTAAREIRAEVVRAAVPDVDQLRQQVNELERLLAESGARDPGALQQLQAAKQELDRLEVAGTLSLLAAAAEHAHEP